MGSLIRLSPMPQELDRAYLGRIKRSNGFETDKEAIKKIARHFGLDGVSHKERSCLELLGLVAGQSIESFAGSHSTVPVRRAITSFFPELAHGSLERRSLLRFSGTALARPGAYFCADCTRADILFHGISYWRRDLQLPGRLWCQLHDTPLFYVEDDDAFSKAPSTLLDSAEQVPIAWVDEAKDNEYVKRYLDIVAGLLTCPRPIDARAATYALRQRSVDRDLQRCDGPVKKALLSDLMIESFPRLWLASIFPTLLEKSHKELLRTVDGVLFKSTSASSVWPYILAASVLFDSADSALNALLSGDVCASRSAVCTKNIAEISESDLLSAYIHFEGSYAAIAKRIGLNPKETTRRLHAMGLPALELSFHSQPIRAARAFYLERKSHAESAKSGNMSPDEFDQLLRSVGPNLIRALKGMRLGQSSASRDTRRVKPPSLSDLRRTVKLQRGDCVNASP